MDLVGTTTQAVVGKTVAEFLGQSDEVDRSREIDDRVMSLREPYEADVEFTSMHDGGSETVPHGEAAAH